MQWFLLGIGLALIIVFIFRKQLKASRDNMIQRIRSTFKKK